MCRILPQLFAICKRQSGAEASSVLASAIIPSVFGRLAGRRLPGRDLRARPHEHHRQENEDAGEEEQHEDDRGNQAARVISWSDSHVQYIGSEALLAESRLTSRS